MLTTKEIARLSKVSRATVSAVINGKDGVRESTRRKVLDVIEQHEGRARFIRKSLVSEISRMIGVVIGSINNPFFTEVTAGIATVLRAHGFHDMLVHATDDRPGRLVSDMSVLMGFNPPGYIVVAGKGEEEGDLINHLCELGKPIVAVGTLEDVNTHVVDVANRQASRDAAEYLIGRGHREIVYLSGPAYRAVAQERTLGFIEAMVCHEIQCATTMTFRAGETARGGYEATLQVLADASKRPTAIACFNDRVAAGVYRAAHELDLRIPEDISVMGFDGIEIGAVMGPPLTTLSVFPSTLGTVAAEMLLEILSSQDNSEFIQRTVEHKLVERGSVADGPHVGAAGKVEAILAETSA